MPVIMAHGALGAFDEVIFIAVGVTFAALMIVAWWRSRGDNIEADPEPPSVTDPSATLPEPDAPKTPDRFRLD
jgi:hypothetical protein